MPTFEPESAPKTQSTVNQSWSGPPIPGKNLALTQDDLAKPCNPLDRPQHLFDENNKSFKSDTKYLDMNFHQLSEESRNQSVILKPLLKGSPYREVDSKYVSPNSPIFLEPKRQLPTDQVGYFNLDATASPSFSLRPPK